MKLFSKMALLLAFVFISTGAVQAQNTKQDKKAAKIATIKNIVEMPNYVFKANYVIPTRGGSHSLMSDYDVVVTKDTVISYLPYFGRAYSAPIGNTTDGGINFTTTKFNYKSVPGKKGNWEITITPKDKSTNDWRSVQYMKLSISADGTASLVVISTNRDAISFNGYVDTRGK